MKGSGEGTSHPIPLRIRVVLPQHLRTLARVHDEVEVAVTPPGTLAGVLDAVEERFPVLRGAIRDHLTKKRRPFVRFFVCQNDWSHEPPDIVLPPAVAGGCEPFVILGAIAGG